MRKLTLLVCIGLLMASLSVGYVGARDFRYQQFAVPTAMRGTGVTDLVMAEAHAVATIAADTNRGPDCYLVNESTKTVIYAYLGTATTTQIAADYFLLQAARPDLGINPLYYNVFPVGSYNGVISLSGLANGCTAFIYGADQ